MASTGLKTLIISVLLVGLFIYALIGFAVQFQTDMDANQTILNKTDSNLEVTYISLKTNLTGAEDTANATRTSFESEEAKSEFGSLTFKSIVGVGKSFTGTMANFFNIIFDLLKVVFGLDDDDNAAFTVVIGTLGAIFLVTVIFFAWRTYRAGS